MTSFKIFKVVFIIALLFSVSSCKNEDNLLQADLEVQVSGTLSGNPRSGLRVTVYTSEEDAENEVNKYTSTKITNSDGFAFFYDLEPGFRYWVRVNTVLINNINRSRILRVGLNDMRMTIL